MASEFDWRKQIIAFDERRDVVVPGDKEQVIEYSTKQIVQIITNAIIQRGICTIAISGGSTPNAIYKKLTEPEFKNQVDWTKVLVFWSDERSVPATSEESNYHNSLEAGIAKLGIPEENLFRMVAEEKIEENALEYEKLIRKHVPGLSFDLIMLGMGEDGHTASLFPKTHGIHATNKLVIANYVPQKSTWRMSFTYELIHDAKIITIYVIGNSKAEMVEKVLLGPYQPEELPIQRIGTTKHKALWILDTEAFTKLQFFQSG